MGTRRGRWRSWARRSRTVTWLTGPELVSNYDVASILELSFEENRGAIIRADIPARIAEMNAQAFSLNADGDAE